jgi:putative tryptophan/tyrosine transport system substrate-binding protein
MRRREFITGAGSLAFAWPFVAHAQRSTPRIGYVWIGAAGGDEGNLGFRQGLADRGYVIGRDVAIEARYAEGHPERIPALIADLVAQKVDILVTPGTPISRAAQRATTTIPIVCISGDPVGAGLVASLSHPGGNITGMSLLSGEYSSKWLELLKVAAPKLHRVAVLWNPDNPALRIERDRLQDAARVLGLEVTFLSSRASEIEATMTALTPATADGFVATDDPILDELLPRLIALAADRHLPAIYPFSTAVKLGGLMSYSANFFTMWHHLAGYVDRILKGAHPGDLPIEQATEVALNVNLKTAKALGLDLPPSLITTANEVVE